MASLKDALLRKTELSEWHRGTPQHIKRAAGSTDEIDQYQYVDDNGWKTSSIDAMGRTTTYSRDSMGRLTGITPMGTWSSTTIGYTFPTTGGAVQTITRGDSKSTITYDSMYRPIKELSEDTSGTDWKSFVNTKYDELGRVTFKTLPSADDTSLPSANGLATTYDGLGRVLTVTETATGGGVTTHSYLTGHIHRIEDPSGATTDYTSYGFKGPGNTVYSQILNSDGGRNTKIIQNEWGEVTQVTQLGTGTSSGTSQDQYFYYDDDRRLCAYKTPEGNTTKYEYDLAGQMTAYAKGQSDTTCGSISNSDELVTLNYDNLGRLTLTNFADTDTPDISQTYDDNGNILSVYRGSGTSAVKWDYGYHDDADLLVSESLSIDGKTFDLTYDYNANQHLIKEVLPTGRPLNFDVDGLGRFTKLSSWNNFEIIKASSVDYSADGTLTDMTYGSGQEYKKTLNARLLTERIHTQKPNGATALDLNYTYDKRGKIKTITDGVDSDNDRAFTYDELGQLTTATGPWGTQTNTYDPLGNILTRKMTGDTKTARNITLSYNSNNRVTQSVDTQAVGAGWGGTGTGTRAVGYDTRGNVTSLGNMGFTYDMSDQPTILTGSRDGTTFTNSNYVYDGNLKRVKSKINGKVIYNVYNMSGRLVHVHDETPFDNGAPERVDYMSAGGMTVARAALGQGGYFMHNDHLGSTATLTYKNGAIAMRSSYSPFGIELNSLDRLNDHAGFTGHIKDGATGLNYMQARYYDPVIGRFLSVDPVTFMDTGNPSFFNRYAYTFNDPINLIDPNGRSPFNKNITMDSTGPNSGARPMGSLNVRATLSLPVRLNSNDKAVITSSFGPRSIGVKGASKNHNGTDFRARNGADILATQDGKIEAIETQPKAGDSIIVRNSDGSRSGHGHTGAVEGLSVGDDVQAGQVIGESNGSGTGVAHQHYTYTPAGSTTKENPMTGQLKSLSSKTCNKGDDGC